MNHEILHGSILADLALPSKHTARLAVMFICLYKNKWSHRVVDSIVKVLVREDRDFAVDKSVVCCDCSVSMLYDQ